MKFFDFNVSLAAVKLFHSNFEKSGFCDNTLIIICIDWLNKVSLIQSVHLCAHSFVINNCFL